MKKTFLRWAKLGHGSYFDATGADDLVEKIAQAVRAISSPEVRHFAGAGKPGQDLVSGDVARAETRGIAAIGVVETPNRGREPMQIWVMK